jgi:hypothetical protein
MTNESDVSPIQPEQLDAVLRFLPIFEQPGVVFGEWRSPEGQVPYYSMTGEAMDFFRAIQPILFPFDWPSWQEEAEKYVVDPQALATAGLLALRKLLTTHVRKDRFVEGHFGAMLESGHITAILRRLREIREQMG